jgi:hypothetical protein
MCTRIAKRRGKGKVRVFYAGIILFAAVIFAAVEAKAVPAGSLEASGVSISPAVMKSRETRNFRWPPVLK